jgi:rare lipoprotein A (peptidoglycan hydrolase)
MSHALRMLFALAFGGLMLAPTEALAYNSVGTTATYYHPSLHGSRMANGLPYNRWDPLIAASNWYPLGTLLKVTRQETGNQIYVRVQDRGSPRLTIDLSEAGFSQLGGLPEGRIRVWAEVVTAMAEPAPAPPEDAASDPAEQENEPEPANPPSTLREPDEKLVPLPDTAIALSGRPARGVRLTLADGAFSAQTARL